jgi:cytochrome P450
VNLIGNGLLALLRHPDQWARLLDDPGLVPNAIEELLRYDSPVQMVVRAVSEPMVLRGQALREGELVMTLVGAVNRDPDVFADPDRLDVTRPQPRSLSFGGGIHFCLGAQLARLEAEIAFTALLRRLPSLALVDADPPRWRESFTLRGLTSLPVHWS